MDKYKLENFKEEIKKSLLRELMEGKSLDDPEEIIVKNLPEKIKIEKPDWYQEPPEMIYIKNLPKFPEFPEEIKISNLQKEIDIKKPEWYKPFEATKFIGDFIGNFVKSIKELAPFEVILKRHEKAENALAVKIFDRKGKQIDKFGPEGIPMPIPGGSGETYARECHIYNVELAQADTEYSQVLPQKTKKFRIYTVSSDKKSVYGDVVFISLTTGTSASDDVIPVVPAGYYQEDKIELSGKTVYFQSPTALGYVIIIAWV